MKGLAGKRVVVTGGASGIGAAIVARFLDEGCRVAVIDRDAAAGRALGEKHPALAGLIPADVSDAGAVSAAFREIDRLLGGVDVAVNNAGISIRHAFLDITPEEWRKVVGVDLDGVFYVAQESARRMLKSGGGVIINMGSTSGMNGYPRYADYNAAKAGVIELTATELPRFGFLTPRLALAGLNPHAGEHGILGTEEQAVLEPAVARCRAAGFNITGPLPADTVFVRALGGEFDAVIACYHDQGLIPVKLVAFGHAVNVTLDHVGRVCSTRAAAVAASSSVG